MRQRSAIAVYLQNDEPATATSAMNPPREPVRTNATQERPSADTRTGESASGAQRGEIQTERQRRHDKGRKVIRVVIIEVTKTPRASPEPEIEPRDHNGA